MPIPRRTRPVEKARVSDKVYGILRDGIVDGDLRPGENLKDAELAERLGVSRTPVREALKRLEGEGLVRSSASRWTRVAEIRVEDVDNLFPIVKCLDVLTLETAFPFMKPDGVAVMRAEYRKQEEALTKGDYRAVAKAGGVFHDAYLLRSNNPELIELNQKMQAKARRLMNFFHESFQNEPALALEGHEPLIQAIADGRLDDGKAILSQHWDFVARLTRKAAIEATEHDQARLR
jgi:DNA-binding GntR family transcriptional regulator